MKKGVLRKAVSLVLALSLVIALMPTMFASAAEVGDKVTYDFTPTKIIQNEAENNDFEYANAGKTAVLTKTLDDYFESANYVRNWKYFSQTLTGAPWTTGANGTYFDGGAYGNWAAFKVKGISEGTYNVTFGKPASNTKGCVWAMYILDGETYANADNEAITSAIADTLGNDVVKVGEFDTYANANASIDLGNVGIKGNETGEYIVVFKAIREGQVDEGETEPSNKTSRFIAMTSLTFTYVSEYVAPPEVATTTKISFITDDSKFGTENVDYTMTGNSVILTSLDEFYNAGTNVRNWKYFASTFNTAHINAATVSNSAGASINGGGNIETNGTMWLAFKIRGLAESDYKVTFDNNNAGRGCVWVMYVLEDDESYYSTTGDVTTVDTAAVSTAINNLSNGVTKVGEFDTFGHRAGSIEIGNVKLSGRTSTEHIVLLRAEREGALVGTETTSESDRKSKSYLSMKTLTFTPVDADDMANDAFAYEEASHNGGDTSVVAYAVYGTDGEVSETEKIATPVAEYGEVCKVEAPQTAKVDDKDYTFLYWAKGMTMDKKQVISDKASFDYLPREGANYLIAVYAEDGAEADSKTEFYNANGQLLTDVTVTDGVMPGYPSMAGFGKAKAWALRNADGSYTEY
ncbi:MAG: hypothetical protein IJ949_04260, partial [Oscillospiraceae bacterium]|nr:hypothetical protein [Oscillospiraceae bacterium]